MLLNPSKPLYVVPEHLDSVSPSSSQASSSSSLSSPGILRRNGDPNMSRPRRGVGAREARVSFADDLGIVSDDGPTQEGVPTQPHDGGDAMSFAASPLSSAAASPRTGLLSGRGFRTSTLAERLRGAFSPVTRKRPPHGAVSDENDAGCGGPQESKSGAVRHETPTPDVEAHTVDDDFSLDEDLFKIKSGRSFDESQGKG